MAVKTLSNLSISSMGTGTSGGATTNRSEWTSINFSTSVSAVTGGGAATETYTLQYSLDGGTTWIDLTTTTASTSQNTVVNFSNVNVSGIAGFQTLNGANVLFQVDVMGNGSKIKSATTTAAFDVVAPTAPTITSVTDNVGTVTGPVAAGGASNDTTPTVRISILNTNAAAGDTVNLLADSTSVGTAVLSATNITNGWVEITPTLTGDGSRTLTATITDAGGNAPASAARIFVLDTTADAGSLAAANYDPAAAGDGDSIVEAAEARELRVNIANVDADATSVQLQFTHNGATITRALTATGGTFNGNHIVDITGLPAGAQSAVTTSIIVTDAAGNVTTRSTNQFQAAICFYPGTRIATPTGERPVEELRRGDLVLTAAGVAAPVRWMGRQTVATAFADPARSLPVRIRAGALGEGLPRRDLLVSPGHAMLVDGVLVTAAALVNGVSIVIERDVPAVFTYHHVELADQSLILAEGAPAETFLDNAARESFDNWEEHAALDDGIAVSELLLPRATSARQVPAATQRRLAALAVELAGLVPVAA
jgi:hypothetical protein